MFYRISHQIIVINRPIQQLFKKAQPLNVLSIQIMQHNATQSKITAFEAPMRSHAFT